MKLLNRLYYDYRNTDNKLELRHIKDITKEECLELLQLIDISIKSVHHVKYRNHGLIIFLHEEYSHGEYELLPNGQIHDLRNWMDGIENITTVVTSQFLVSKGFNIPCYYLGGKTPVEAGIAILL